MKSYKELTEEERINRRLQLFSCTSYEEMESITDDPADLEIIAELKRLSQDEKFMKEYKEEIEYKEKLRKEQAIKEEDCIPCIKITIIKSNEMEEV